MALVVAFFFCVMSVMTVVVSQTKFRYANTQGNHMVLQQKPYKSQIWGFCDANSMITLTLTFSQNNSIIQQKNTTTNTDSIWIIQLDPMPTSFTTYNITSKCSTTSNIITLTNILFGDIFLCSGQSNMQFTVDQAFNATENIQQANDYPYIRVFTSKNNMVSNTIETELPGILEPWSIANNKTIGCGNWSCFSAVCWFTGIKLYQQLNYPLGLISTVHSGSPVRCWMPYETASECNENITENGYGPSICWNAMINPFLRTTIKAVLWYQGEQDTKIEPLDYEYSCAFPLMIDLWRQFFSNNSDTDPNFPFGFVQLSVFLDSTENITCGNNKSVSCLGAAMVRHGQIGNYSYIPNKIMDKTFFATAIDLGDPSTPYTAPLGPVHPRYKKPIGDRLADGALNIIYGGNQYWGGPYVEKAIFNHTKNIKGYDIVTVVFTNVGEQGLMIKNYVGIELYDQGEIGWFNAFQKLEINGDFSVDVMVPTNVKYTKITMIRYNFYTAPCLPFQGPYNCAIYDKQHEIPAIPFIINVTSG